ncbi:MAG TPA: hypothetical protein VIJ16_06605 [Gemmatimonadaceae bacterium]
MVVRRGQAAYAVEVKAAPEGRGDRLVPLWAQAWLEVSKSAAPGFHPLAVVAAPKISRQAAERVLRFAADYAPSAAAGVIDFEGLRLFRGDKLEEMDASPSANRHRHEHKMRANLFSDLNQWMLKVLLAPELPERLLAAPRGPYRNASQLAEAAEVSVMSAFRFVEQLRDDGYLDESAPSLRLVRRDELLSQWRAAVAAKPIKDVPVRLLIRGIVHQELRRVAGSGQFCMGLFAAADALGFGFVRGVPPHVYVRDLRSDSAELWKIFVRAEPSEAPDAILRQAHVPESLFRASVVVDGMPVSDIVQVWLDVSAHPSRGVEQAELIRKRVLGGLISSAPPSTGLDF